MPPPASNPDLCPFDLETGVRVASEVGNLHSKFGHAKPFRSRIIRYVRDGRTDGRTDKSNAYCPLPYGKGHTTTLLLLLLLLLLIIIIIIIIIITKRALGRAHLPLIKVFRRLSE